MLQDTSIAQFTFNVKKKWKKGVGDMNDMI